MCIFTHKNNKMGKILKLLVGILCGGLIGVAIAVLIAYLIDGKEALDVVSSKVDAAKLAGSIALSCVLTFVALILQIILHEVGHMIGGLATGYKFFSIRFSKYALVKTGKELHWRQYDIAGTGGQCVMFLDKDIDIEQDSTPYFWYNAGGVATNILLSVISIIVVKYTDMGVAGSSFFMLMAFVGIVMALLNGIPMNMGAGINNDGRNILMLSRSAQNRRLFIRSFQIIGELGHGVRPKNMPKEWFSSEIPTGGNDYFGIVSYISYISLLEDEGLWDEARIAYEHLENIKPKLPLLFALETASEHILTELLTQNRRDVVEKLWTKQAAKYTTNNYKYSPSKLAALYAIELLYNKDEKKALQLYEELQKRKDMFYLPGETAMALSIAEQIAKL